MYIAILGRQPELGHAELKSLYGQVVNYSEETALVDTEHVNLTQLGGALKVGEVVLQLPNQHWKQIENSIIDHYLTNWQHHDGKITLGLSTYDLATSPKAIQKIGITLKSRLKKHGVSLRLIPNQNSALSTATSHHNKLGLSANKVELLIVGGRNGSTIIAESIGSQNITAYARRDQARPKRDAFVGMLPPKLAQIMINLALGSRQASTTNPATILDPFCGTGVILQEAALINYAVYGTDLSEKMVRYSRDNLNWLQDSHRIRFEWQLETGDAMTHKWRQPIDAVVCESYLGQPFSAPPSPAKLREVVRNCNHIISDFLTNIHPQLAANTPLCIAVPAWRNQSGSLTHLPLALDIRGSGFELSQPPLVYARPDQVVTRELLVLTRL